MDPLATNINFQTLVGLLITVFALMLVLLGYLLARFTFLDGKSFYFSKPLGRILIVTGGILAFASLLLIIYIRLAY